MTGPTTSGAMFALVKSGPGLGGVAVQSVPVPHASQGQVRLQVQATGVCGTDLHIVRDEFAHRVPVVMGHEICGVIDEVGPGVDPGLLGKLAALETYASVCGVCDWCQSGRINLCPARRSLGSFENGGFAPYVTAPAINVHVLPATITGVAGALSEPLACACHCLLDPPVIGAGDRVLVIGPGAMGQLSAQVAKACGADVTLVGLERDAARLAVAARRGIATSTSRPEPDAFDVVIECSGSAGGAAVALGAARRGGRYVQVGIFGRPVEIALDTVLYKELRVSSGSASTPASWRRAIALIHGDAVDLASLITNQVPLPEWESAFADVSAGAGVKTVIVPFAARGRGQ